MKKRCAICEQDLSEDKFYVRCDGYLHSYCNECTKIKNNAQTYVFYLSGKITSEDNFKELFRLIEMQIREKFNPKAIINPIILPDGLKYRDYMRVDMVFVEIADVIVMLPNWKESSGARAEHEYAKSLGKKIYYERW